ncbi:hypothetical protein DVH05_017114 [Phytophthora capsici]|nr:hypothetical protein DVH05_017114 [Phytophthora capsici]
MRQFLQELQAQLLQVTASDFVEEIFPTEPVDQVAGTISTAHKLVKFPEWTQIREGVRKRPQHQCTVCSIRKQKVRQRSATRFYCEACSDGNKRVYLCDRVRPNHYPSNNMTCHQISHIKWKNGEERPRPRVGRDIQMRGLGKRRRMRMEDDAEEDDENEDDSDAEEDGDSSGGDAPGSSGDASSTAEADARSAVV